MLPTIYPVSQVLEAIPGEYYSLLSVCQTIFDTVHYTDTRFILLIKEAKPSAGQTDFDSSSERKISGF